MLEQHLGGGGGGLCKGRQSSCAFSSEWQRGFRQLQSVLQGCPNFHRSSEARLCIAKCQPLHFGFSQSSVFLSKPPPPPHCLATHIPSSDIIGLLSSCPAAVASCPPHLPGLTSPPPPSPFCVTAKKLAAPCSREPELPAAAAAAAAATSRTTQGESSRGRDGARQGKAGGLLSIVWLLLGNQSGTTVLSLQHPLTTTKMPLLLFFKWSKTAVFLFSIYRGTEREKLRESNS